MKKRAFTLIEILLVISIILVLSAIIFPVISRARDSGKLSSALQQMKELGTAFALYSGDADGAWAPSTNYGLPAANPKRIWSTIMRPYASSNEIFVAPGSGGKFASGWADRGEATIGLSAATAVNLENGCDTDTKPTNGYEGCQAFDDTMSGSDVDGLSSVGLFAVTPGGDTTQRYRGFEFNPYNGHPNLSKPKLGPPLVSDRDLVKELSFTPGKQLKPIYARYLSTGRDEGFTPVVFADSHAKQFSAKSIATSQSGIVWRFR